MSTRLIDITDIEQGTIDNYGNQSSSTRVRSAGRYPINFFGLQIKINVESSSSIKTNIMLYTDSTTNRALWDSGWFDNGQGIDISNYPTAKYFRVVLRKSDGANIIPSDIVSCEAEIVESDGIQNIDNWIKNSADFTQFDNVYSNGLNTLTFTGGGGCERIYFPVNVTQGISLTFSLKFCSPTGFTCQYGDNKDYIAITKAVPSGSGQITDFQILGRTAVSSDASSVLREHSVTVTPNYSGIAYLVIDMGYMTDNVQTELIYSDISAKIDYDWKLIDGEITNRNFISMPEKYMEKPYPAALWRIDPEINNGYPYNELLLFESKSGAFMNASNLQTVYIPRTCKKIGERAFTNTALKKVLIPADCTYYETSFPPDCEVQFYGGGGDYGQLFDGDGYAVLDGDGARIYIGE